MLKVNEYGGRQAKGNEKKQCLKGWETLVNNIELSINAKQEVEIDSISCFDIYCLIPDLLHIGLTFKIQNGI